MPLGDIEDILVLQDDGLIFLVIAWGGFLSLGRRLALVPIKELHESAGTLLLPGWTASALAALPQFKHPTKRERRDLVIHAAAQEIRLAKICLGQLDAQFSGPTTCGSPLMSAHLRLILDEVRDLENGIEALRQAPCREWQTLATTVASASERLRRAVHLARR